MKNQRNYEMSFCESQVIAGKRWTKLENVTVQVEKIRWTALSSCSLAVSSFLSKAYYTVSTSCSTKPFIKELLKHKRSEGTLKFFLTRMKQISQLLVGVWEIDTLKI